MDEIRMMLTLFALDIRLENAPKQGDVHSKSEEIVAYLLQSIYGYSFPGRGRTDLSRSVIDLYDEEAEGGLGVAIQVTKSNTRQKAIHTIQRFTEHHPSERLCDRYKTLMIVILSMDVLYASPRSSL